MRFLSYRDGEVVGLAALHGGEWRGRADVSSLDALVGDAAALSDAARLLRDAPAIDLQRVTLLPPLQRPGKIVCVGLNYRDHTSEVAFEQPDYPTLFARYATSLVGHGEALLCPPTSEQFDYEGELVAVIGRRGRRIERSKALDHVAGWSIFNDASVRDYQFRTPQWTVGKNFDATGAFGPWFATADELPRGAAGLRLETRLNGRVVQSASTSDMVFDVPTLVEIISEAMTLEPGDIIVTGTPAGVGFARKPPLWMQGGDIVEVEVEGLGTLRNPVAVG